MENTQQLLIKSLTSILKKLVKFSVLTTWLKRLSIEVLKRILTSMRNGSLFQVIQHGEQFITLVLQRGMTYKAVMKITGIRKIETIMLYDRVDDKELVNQVSRVFGKS